MNIAIVVVTHNRLEYTGKCIERLLENPTEEFDLYLWDNASKDETAEYLKDGIKDSRIKEVIISKENLGQTGAMNYAWSRTKAELIGKLDNDCLVTPGWTQILAKAHEDIENLGAVACWHYPLDEFDEEAARKAGKIQSFGCHQIFRHPWVCGSGFMMKRKTYEAQGPWKVGCDIGTTYYFVKMAWRGYINGWYYPPLMQEHMDDLKSEHTLLIDDESIRRLHDVTFSLRTKNIRDMESRWARRRLVLGNLFNDPWEAKYYVGWRAKLRRAKAKIRGVLKT
jgi:glycosyltransferase involved in cell wall biosynthesis